MLYIGDLVINKSKINRLGIFANKDFEVGEEILKFIGNPHRVIYFNHSCVPNSYVFQPDEGDMQTHILYSKGIRKGEEITFDYRIGKLYRDEWKEAIEGRCTCPKCKVW